MYRAQLTPSVEQLLRPVRSIRGIDPEFVQAADEWLTYCVVQNYTPTTIAWYSHELRVIGQFLSVRAIAYRQLDRKKVRDFVQHLQSERPNRQSHATGLKTSTINAHLRALRTLVRFTAREWEQQDNCGIKLLRDAQLAPSSLSLEQTHALLRQLDTSVFKELCDHTMLLLILDAGLRLAELVGLDIVDVNIADSLIRVLGKGRRERLVPVGSNARQNLYRYIKARNRFGTADTALFIGPSGGRINRRDFQRRVTEYGHRAGLRGLRVSPHTLRHTFAKLYVLNGGDAFSLQRILGHTTITMTRRYVNFSSMEFTDQHRRFSPGDMLHRYRGAK